MSTNYHTAIAVGAAANAATFNAPLGQLDAAITTGTGLKPDGSVTGATAQAQPFTFGVKVDTISELTAGAGVTFTTTAAAEASQGATLLTNGTFATNDFTGWTAGANWSAATGAAVHTAGSTATLTQDFAVTSGNIYQVAFTTSGRTAGSITLTAGTATLVVQVVAVGVTAIITNGTYDTSFKASSTGNIAFTITPTTDYDGTIDTISIKEVTAGAAAVTVTDSGSNAMFELRGKNGSTAGNIGIGISALENLTTAVHNTAFGMEALQETTTGDGNCAVGKYALQYNQSGAWNTGVGMEALRRLVSGYDNTAVGEGAAEYLTTGSRNVAVGKYAMILSTTSSDLVAVGGSALYSNVTGIGLTAVGGYALQKSTANYNTALGYYAAIETTTGANNTAVGTFAMQTNTTGENNVALGYSALGTTPAGSYNTAVGYAALNYATGGSNVAVGFQAGIGVTSANAVVADSEGVLIGYRVGRSVVSATTLVNYVGIGSKVEIGKSNQVVIGNTDIEETLLRGKVGIETEPAAQLHVDQAATDGAVPALTLDQADVSEPFIKLIGESTTDNTQSLIDAADLEDAGAIVGWFKVYIEDVQGTNPITDGTYWVPFYATPTHSA